MSEAGKMLSAIDYWHQDEALRADLTGLVRAVGEVLGCESVMCCHCATVLREAIAPALAKETP